MSVTAENNKRIAKNTLFLYIRMLLTMGVSLYTSRVILQTLGVVDCGVYNVVGGFVTMFTFLNGGMITSTQRYLNFEIGSGNEQQLSKVFSTALQIHALIVLVIIFLSETIGLWFLYEKLIIPSERMNAAFWVYQCSIIACVVNIMSIPYNADIIAHEKMSAFAYISIAEVSLKLLIVYLLYISPFDRLIAYAILLFIVQLFISCIYIRYCGKHFPESHYRHKINKQLLKEMGSFAGWGVFGSLANILYTQGLNILLNLFFGPIVNAARGFAVQVQSAMHGFVGNFQMALNPQITKNYALGNMSQMHILMFRSARFSFILLFLLTLPIIIETEYVLILWLKTPPPNTVIFTKWMLAVSLLYTISNPCIIANQATGKVKVYQIVVSSVLLSIVPISYVALLLGAPAYIVFTVHFCMETLAQFMRMYLLRNLINLPIKVYFKNIYLPIILVVILSVFAPLCLRILFPDGFTRFIIVCFSSILSVAFWSYLIGLTKNEKRYVFDKLLEYIHKL